MRPFHGALKPWAVLYSRFAAKSDSPPTRRITIWRNSRHFVPGLRRTQSNRHHRLSLRDKGSSPKRPETLELVTP
jgi:hypothetical protein